MPSSAWSRPRCDCGAPCATPSLPEPTASSLQLDAIAKDLDEVLEGLREIARGIHPVILAEGGLRPALKALARRSVVPVSVESLVDERLPEEVELAAYYVVAEALTNAAKHAEATSVDVRAEVVDRELVIQVQDDGRGGALASHGSGLIGLADRAEAMGGRFSVHSPPGDGTTIQVSLPVDRLTDAVRGSTRVVLAGRAI